LPEVTVLELVSFDEDGDGFAKQTGKFSGEDPTIRVLLSRKAGRAPTVGQTILARLTRIGPFAYEARIIRVLERQKHRLFGVVEAHGKTLVLSPAERGKRQVINLQPDPAMTCQPGDLIEAELLNTRGYLGKAARPIRNFGPVDERGAFSTLALAEFGIRHVFPEAAIAETEGLRVPPVRGRTDLRNTPLVTIDGADARDFDDAVFAEPLEAGGWRVIVAIADVAHYVRPGSALDSEARLRGNSVYLPDMVVPMLPEAISNDLCSLRPDEDRAAMVVEMIISDKGERQNFSFFRALIRSHARLTYDQVQSVFDGVLDEKDVGAGPGVLHNLFGAWRALTIARQHRAPLALNLKERRVIMDANDTAIAIAQTRQSESQRLIEDFMIAANVAAADRLIAARKPCVFRVHDRPDPKKAEGLYDLAEAIGAPFARGQVLRPALFNRLLAHVEGSSDEIMVNESVLRAQAKAVYSLDNIGHFGLALRNYAHFTSPIRRYSDLLIHRALIDATNSKREPKDGLRQTGIGQLAEICTHISETEANAAAAERRTIDRFAAALFKSREQEIVVGVIVGVTGYGAFVRLDDGIADGFLPLSGLPDDFYDLDSAANALRGRHNGWSFLIGTRLEVRVEDVTPVNGGILLSWVSGGTVDDRPPRKRRAGQQKRAKPGQKRHPGHRKSTAKSGRRKSR